MIIKNAELVSMSTLNLKNFYDLKIIQLFYRKRYFNKKLKNVELNINDVCNLISVSSERFN